MEGVKKIISSLNTNMYRILTVHSTYLMELSKMDGQFLHFIIIEGGEAFYI